MHDMAYVCYEIGNKHLPLFYDKDELLVPYDAPVFRMLEASGFNPVRQQRKLLSQLKTTVAPHNHAGTRESLFSKILQLTNAADAK
jgi:urease accessory protein